MTERSIGPYERSLRESAPSLLLERWNQTVLQVGGTLDSRFKKLFPQADDIKPFTSLKPDVEVLVVLKRDTTTEAEINTLPKGFRSILYHHMKLDIVENEVMDIGAIAGVGLLSVPFVFVPDVSGKLEGNTNNKCVHTSGKECLSNVPDICTNSSGLGVS